VTELEKLDRSVQIRIVSFLRRLEATDAPRGTGKALHGERAGLWRYRIGDYRLISNIDDQARAVRVLRIGHRKDVYR
jgi:mRNA interferase RelE/StbE